LFLTTAGVFQAVPPTGGPFTFFGRHDVDDRLRPNPQVQTGTIASGVGTVRFDWDANDITAAVRGDLEAGRFWPVDVFVPPPSGVPNPALDDLNRNRSFAQLTLDGSISFPTFGTQSLSVSGHAVLTTHGTTPRQRYAYVGGSGTIPTIEMLELGGDQLLYVDTRYSIPLERVMLPLVGSPTVVLRHAMGSAGIGTLPNLEQATGLRVVVSVLYAELLVDPVSRRTHRTIGLSFAR
jgi:hypothetical protein